MRCSVADWQAWAPRAAAGARIQTLPDPERPPEVPEAHWRRMGRLGRAVTACASAVLGRHPELDRAALPVVWGTSLGEVDASSQFLDRLAAEGPSRVSPLVFQGSVYNAAVARLSLAYGLRGPTETIAAGQATALAALARGAEWLDRAPAVLVIAGDELPWAARTALEAAEAPPGEGALAVLIVRGDDLVVEDGAAGPSPRFGRRRLLPYELAALPPVDEAVEDALGLAAVLPLVRLLQEGKGSAIAADDDAAISARWAHPQDLRS